MDIHRLQQERKKENFKSFCCERAKEKLRTCGSVTKVNFGCSWLKNLILRDQYWVKGKSIIEEVGNPKEKVDSWTKNWVPTPHGLLGGYRGEREKRATCLWEGFRVYAQFMDILLFGWWWDKQESTSSTSGSKWSVGLHACGQHVCGQTHLTGFLPSAKQFKRYGAECFI